ncbi:MAG TPA: hypothetical protein VK694_05045 [Verrucomicrobiae bacterium]|nr:hypothetical protein [Verrucomicrobiae bacterium]
MKESGPDPEETERFVTVVEYIDGALAVGGMVLIEVSDNPETIEDGAQEFTFWFGAASIVIAATVAVATGRYRFREYRNSKRQDN